MWLPNGIDTRGHAPQWGAWLGGAGLSIFCFSALWSTSGIYLGLLLMLVGFLPAVPAAWPLLKREPVFWLTTMFTVYVALRAYWAASDDPGLAAQHWNDGRSLMWAFGVFVVVVGFWLAAFKRNIAVYLALAGVGFVVGLVMEFEWAAFFRGGWGREVFGINPNLVAVYGGSIAIGLGVGLTWLLRRSHAGDRSSVARWTYALLALLGFAFFSVITLYTGSRSAYLGAASVAAVTAGYIGANWLGERRTVSRKSGATVVLLLLVLVSLFVWSPELVADRVARLWNSLTGHAVSPAQADVAVDYRLLMWREALQAIKERPLFGWGPAAAEAILPSSTHETIRRFSQFHSLYLEVLVTIGIAGGALLASMYALLIKGVWTFYRHGKPQTRADGLAVFVLLAILYFLVCAVSKLQINHPDGMAYVMLLSGLAYQFRLRSMVGEPAASAPGVNP